MAAASMLEDLSGSDLLEEVSVLHRTRQEAGVRILFAVAEFAHQHGEDGFDPKCHLDGAERLVRLGGAGTPMVAEFAPAELAARMQLSPYAGRRLVADVLDLQHRLPWLWKRVQALEVREGHARFVAAKTRDLTLKQAGFVDARVAESADGRLAWSRFETLVEASIIAVDLEAAKAREEQAAAEEFARATRSTSHGIRGFYIRAAFSIIAGLDATVAYLAEALAELGDDRNLDQRRVTAILLIANPVQAVEFLAKYAAWRASQDTGPEQAEQEPAPAPTLDYAKLLPATWLFIHLGGSRTARVEDHGPVTEDWSGPTSANRQGSRSPRSSTR